MDIVWTVSSTLRQSSLVVEYKTWMLNVISSVADPEGVPWVPWKSSFDEKFMRKHSTYSTLTLELRTSASTVAIMHVCQLLYQEFDAHMG